MKERIIALSSLAAGLAALGLVAGIQIDPLSLTRGAPALLVMDPPQRVTWSLPPQETATALEATPVVNVPPVYIYATRSALPLAQVLEEQLPLEPCSTWRDLGPKHVTDGIATGTHWVRDLC